MHAEISLGVVGRTHLALERIDETVKTGDLSAQLTVSSHFGNGLKDDEAVRVGY